MSFEEIKAALEAAKTDEDKKAVMEKYGAELSQDQLIELCGKKITKEQMEMIAAGSGASAFYCCAWQ